MKPKNIYKDFMILKTNRNRILKAGVICVFMTTLFSIELPAISQDYDSLTTVLAKLLTEDPNNAYAYKAMADLKVLENKLNEAIINYGKALEIDSLYFEAFLYRGIAYYKAKEYDLALADINNYLAQIDNVSAIAYYNKGLIYHEIKKYKEAQTNYLKAIHLKDDYIDAYYNLGILKSEINEFSEAIKYYNKALEIMPNHSLSMINRAFAFYKLKHFDNALAGFKKSLELDSTYKVAYKYIGLIYIENKNYDLGCENILKAVENGIEGSEKIYKEECMAN